MITTKAIITDIAERVGWSFVQNFVGVLVLSFAAIYNGDTWLTALLTAAWAALIALATSILAHLTDWQPTGYWALVDRAGRTFLQSLLGLLVTSTITSFADAGALKALALACVTALVAAVKSVGGLANPKTLHDSTMVYKYEYE